MAGGEFGFEKMPTVLTMALTAAIEQELPVAFRASDRAFHNLRFESQLFSACPHLQARRCMLCGVAHNAALSDLSFTGLELRLYENDDSPRSAV
jgi:hypothetical protein